MNARTFWISCCLSLLIGRADEVRFLNGDRIQGTITGLDGESLECRPRWADDSIRIPARYVGYARSATTNTKAVVHPDTRLRFTNGNLLRCTLNSLNAEEVDLSTTWGAGWKANSRMLESVSFLPSLGEIALEGFGQKSDWQVGPRYENSRTEPFVITAGQLIVNEGMQVARKVPEFPVSFHLSLRLKAARNSQYISIIPYGNSPHRSDPGGVSLQMNGSSVFCTTVSETGRSQNIWNEQVKAPIAAPGGVTFDLFGNRENGSFTLLLNNQAVKSWRIPVTKSSVTKDGEAWMSFVAHNVSGLKLTDLSLRTWDGAPPAKALAELNPLEDVDQALFKNGDVVQGRILGVDAENVFFQLPGVSKALEIERSRIMGIRFSSDSRFRTRRTNRDVELWIGGSGDRLVLSLDGIDETVIRGQSEHWLESLEIPRDRVALTRYNIYHRRRLDNVEFKEEWSFAPSGLDVESGDHLKLQKISLP